MEHAAAEDIVRRNFRHNFIVNLLDGSLFWLGYNFMAPGVILPLYVSHFTDYKVLIGLVAVMSSAGYFIPQLFTANWVEKTPVKKKLPVNLGFFTERFPLLVLPLTTLFARLSTPKKLSAAALSAQLPTALMITQESISSWRNGLDGQNRRLNSSREHGGKTGSPKRGRD